MILALRYGGTHAKVDSRAKDSALLKKPAAALPCIASLVLGEQARCGCVAKQGVAEAGFFSNLDFKSNVSLLEAVVRFGAL